jgi:hypothetical protein
MPLNQQTINIGSEPNDGTGDSVYVAFQKVNSNFSDIYTLLGFGAGFSFLRLKEAPTSFRPNAILQMNSEGNKFLNKILVAGTGINIDFVSSSTEIRIVNTASSLSSDRNPTLVADLNAQDAFTIVNMRPPSADGDGVSQQWVYENFVNRDGITRYDNTSVAETAYNGSSTIRSNVVLLSAPTSSTHLVNKGYVDNLVDNSGFASKQNFFVSLSGDDHQYTLPSYKRGRAFAYAFKTVNRAAVAAEQFIAASQIVLGPYQKTITMSSGVLTPVVTSISPSTLLDTSSFGIRLRMTLDASSFNIGSDPFINKSIFPGNYIVGARSEAVGLIEAITLDSINGYEYYDITPVDYAKPYRMAIEPEPFSYSAYVTSGGEITEVGFLLDVADSIDIPDFWIGYKFVITNSSYGIKSYGYISKIIQELDDDQNVRDTIIVDFQDGLPLQDGDLIDFDKWHVYSADFELNEELQWGQKQNKNQSTIMIESGEHEDQYPIKIADNVSTRGDEFRRSVIKPAPLFGTRLPGISSSKWANTYFFRDAQIDGILTNQLNTSTDYASVAGITINSTDNDPVTKTVTVTLSSGVASSLWIGKIFKTNGSVNAQGEIRSVSSNAFTVSLAQNEVNFEKSAYNYTVGNTIAYGSWHIYDPYKYGYHYLRDASRPVNTLTTQTNSGGYNNAATIMSSNRDFIRAECIGFLNATYPSFVFDENKCSRDIGIIVDAVVYDLRNGGNNRTINAGDSYRNVAVVKNSQLAETVAAINYINTIGQRIIQNRAPLVSYQSVEAQIFSAPVPGLVSSGSDVILADLVQACSRIVNNDPAFNPPKYNDQMDVFLMNDATINRYISAQGHGGFMKVLDPDGQILAKSPYTQTASSFSKSKNRHVFSGGMFIDGYAGNTVMRPASITNAPDTGYPIKINSALTTGSIGRPSVVPGEGYIRPQVPCFFVNQGVTYEVSFVSNFNAANGTGSLNLNPLRPGGIASVTHTTTIATGFRTGATRTIPVRFGAPTQAGGQNSTGTAVINSAGAVQSVTVAFPGSGYANGSYIFGSTTGCPNIVIGAARISWTKNSSGAITGYEIIDGGSGYAAGTAINFPSSGGVTATASVSSVDGNGAITGVTISNAGSGYNSDPAVTFGTSLAYTLVVSPGFIATAAHPLPNEITLITAGNRSMLANDFTQMNDLGYGIFCTNGGLVENVSMFTYYCYSAYYSLNGAQCRSIGGSTSYGLNGLKSEGSDPTEVPIAIRNKRTTSQIVTVNAIGTYTNRAEDALLYVDGVSYPPLSQSQIEINHSGTVVVYNVKSAVQDSIDSNVYGLSLDDGTGQGLRFAVPDGERATLRVYYNQELLDINAVTLGRPSTVLSLDEDPTYVYRVLKYTDLGGDTALAESDTPYNYINLTPWSEGNGLYSQGLGEITITSGGSGFASTTTQYAATIPAPSTAGTASVSGTVTDTDLINLSGASGTIMIGSRVTLTSGGDPNGVPTYVTFVNAGKTLVRVDREWTWTNSTGLTFSGIQAVGYGMANSSGQINKIVLTTQGAGYDTNLVRNISISGGATDATATSFPVGVIGSGKIKIVDLDARDEARINTGLAASTPYYYVFGSRGFLYRITDYKNSDETGNSWGEITVLTVDTGSLLQRQILSTTLKAGITANQPGDITVRISTMRVTGHDMLNVGTGGYADSKYPNDLYGPPNNPPDSSLEVQEVGKGRVYSATTDQDGNFKVGKFFSVDQGRGTVSISAPISLTNVDGISFKRGQTLVQVFSVDGTMGGNSNNSVPTERAIQTYVNSRLGLNRNNTTAGVSPIGNGFLDRGGVLEMLDTIKMGDNRIVNMADALADKDALNRRSGDLRYINTSGDTMVGELSMGNNKITNLSDATSDQDALNRRSGDLRYVNTTGDTLIGPLTTQNLTPSSNATYSIGADLTRYSNVYANNLYGTVATSQLSGSVAILNGGTGAASASQALTNLLPGGATVGYVLTTNGPGSFYWGPGGGGGGTPTGTRINSSRITANATAGQTVFTSPTYVIGAAQLRVYVNGVRQDIAEYTETSTSTFTMGVGLNVDDQVIAEVDGFINYQVTAAATSFEPVGDLASTNVQSALGELDTDKMPKAGGNFTGNVSIIDANLTLNTGYVDVLGGSLRVDNITTGAAATPGTITGAWTLTSGSTLQATYADLAEYYEGDTEYAPGTVLVFGGDKEVTVTDQANDIRLAGVVTTNPAYVMNSEQTGIKVCIALAGRIPVQVIGTVKKGDMLTTSDIPGFATKATNPTLGSIIGKALENKSYNDPGAIQVAVGRA